MTLAILLEHLVSRGVAVGVVVALEVIDIQRNYGNRGLLHSLHASHLIVNDDVDTTTVAKPCHFINGRLLC
jgi:hypothetical protein